MSNVKIVAKLSAKSITGASLDAPTAAEKKFPIFAVTGFVNSVSTGETDKGPWIAFLGNFSAVKLTKKGEVETGDDALQLRSGKLFLPPVAENLLLGPIQSADKGANIEFGFIIGIERDETSATNYVYYAEPLIAPDQNDPLEKLTSTAFGALPTTKAIAGPKN